MKKRLRAVLIALLALTVLIGFCVFLFRYFVTNQVTDRGGMENPEAGAETQRLPDEADCYDTDRETVQF